MTSTLPPLKLDCTADIEQRLRAVFSPLVLRVENTTAEHVGHPGYLASGQAGHYRVYLISELFKNQPVVKRHQLVYEALAGWIPSRIHALCLTTLAPGE